MFQKKSARRFGLVVTLVALSFTLQACSISMQQIMQAAGGLLVGLSQQVSNPALRSLMQSAGMALGQSPQSFDQFLQSFASTLATNMAGSVLPPGAGAAIDGSKGGSYAGNPSNPSSTSLSGEARSVLSILQSTGIQLGAQVSKDQIRKAAETACALVPEQYRKQAVDRVTEEVYSWLQQQARQQGQTTSGAGSTTSPVNTGQGTGSYPQGGNAPPQAPAGGSVTVGGSYGGYTGSVTIPVGNK